MSNPVIFFDDNTSNVLDMENVNKCTSVHVDPTQPHIMSGKSYGLSDGNKYIDDIISKGDNSDNPAYFYADILKTRHIGEPDGLSNGFNEENKIALITWINDTKIESHRYVIFDWDKTLAITEGFVTLDGLYNIAAAAAAAAAAPGANIIEDKIASSVADYILGGQERINNLKATFSEHLSGADGTNIKIMIITRNRAAETKNVISRNIFLKIVKIIFPLFDEKNLIYCSGKKSNCFNTYITSLKGGKKNNNKKTRQKKIDKKKRKTTRRHRRH